MEPPSIPEIDKAARQYVEVRDERMALTTQETDRRAKLLQLMKEHKQDNYTTKSGMQVTVTYGDEKVKVKAQVDEDD